MRKAASLVLFLFAFWLLMSGIYVPFLVGSGLLSAVFVVWLARRMEMVDEEGHPVRLGLSVLAYWPWLFREIVVSGWTVTKIILDPRLPISPTLVRFKPRQRTTVGLVTHANSITLTPGTISIGVRSDEFLVHALTKDGAQGVVDSEMDRRVERFEGGL